LAICLCAPCGLKITPFARKFVHSRALADRRLNGLDCELCTAKALSLCSLRPAESIFHSARPEARKRADTPKSVRPPANRVLIAFSQLRFPK
jgi:hypothetical protein